MTKQFMYRGLTVYVESHARIQQNLRVMNSLGNRAVCNSELYKFIRIMRSIKCDKMSSYHFHFIYTFVIGDRAMAFG